MYASSIAYTTVIFVMISGGSYSGTYYHRDVKKALTFIEHLYVADSSL